MFAAALARKKSASGAFGRTAAHANKISTRGRRALALPTLHLMR